MNEKIIKTKGLSEFFTEEQCFITELLNSSDFGKLSIARARVAPGVTTTKHRLLETDEIYYILSGTGEMEIDSIKIGFVTENDLVFIPKNKMQRITNIADRDLLFLCICVPRFEAGNYDRWTNKNELKLMLENQVLVQKNKHDFQLFNNEFINMLAK